MNLTVLGASGETGQEITRQALERGHTVTAIARNPDKIVVPGSERLTRISADVRDPKSIAAALAGSSVVISGLGVSKDEKPGILTDGARAIVEARPDRIVWLGALGSGESAGPAGLFTRTLVRTLMRPQLADKEMADALILKAGGTVFHAGIISKGPNSPTRRTLTLDKVPRRIFPVSVSRATLVAAMLDEAERQQYTSQTVIPFDQ